jgi:hypothetical protein
MGNNILIEMDESCEMARVSVNGECIKEGNYWDFHDGCITGDLEKYGRFNNLSEFIVRLKAYYSPIPCVINYGNYKYKYA